MITQSSAHQNIVKANMAYRCRLHTISETAKPRAENSAEKMGKKGELTNGEGECAKLGERGIKSGTHSAITNNARNETKPHIKAICVLIEARPGVVGWIM
jgi:hypothetical protein